MPPVDYIKIIDIISQTLNTRRKVDIDASHERVDIITVTAHTNEGSEIKYQIRLNNYDVTIVMPQDVFKTRNFNKWISTFEYEMEQAFLTNIKLEVKQTIDEYHIKTGF